MDLFSSGQSLVGQSIDAEVDHLVDLIIEYSTRVEERLKKMQIKIIEDLEKFKRKFPVHNKNYEITGDKIDNKNMARII